MGYLDPVFYFFDHYIYVYPLLMSFVWMIGGIIFYFRHEFRKTDLPDLESFPPFSILIPCHNEERHIENTVQQLLRIDYPNYEIILIDDGSTDHTASIIHALCTANSQVRSVYLKQNQGKAAALTIGTMASNYELLLTIDADALVEPEALRHIAWHFTHFPRVGAVTGNPRIINRSTLLAKIQVGEFSTIIGLIKRSQRILGKVLTVSGVMAAFRKSALHSVGYWSTRMATEDIDITWKLERHFWDIRYEPRALCWIYVPETLKGLWRQRFRWAQGGVEVLKKHISIWKDYRQRRLWPIYIESCLSIIWAYCFWIFFLLALAGGARNMILGLGLALPLPFPPRWAGSMLALVCLLQFCISLFIDRKYDYGLGKYLLWIIWYPFLYWMIASIAVIFATPKAIFFENKQNAIWTDSDRGFIT